MSELPPEGYPEGSQRVWGLTITIQLKDVFFQNLNRGKKLKILFNYGWWFSHNFFKTVPYM